MSFTTNIQFEITNERHFFLFIYFQFSAWHKQDIPTKKKWTWKWNFVHICIAHRKIVQVCCVYLYDEKKWVRLLIITYSNKTGANFVNCIVALNLVLCVLCVLCLQYILSTVGMKWHPLKALYHSGASTLIGLAEWHCCFVFAKSGFAFFSLSMLKVMAKEFLSANIWVWRRERKRAANIHKQKKVHVKESFNVKIFRFFLNVNLFNALDWLSMVYCVKMACMMPFPFVCCLLYVVCCYHHRPEWHFNTMRTEKLFYFYSDFSIAATLVAHGFHGIHTRSYTPSSFKWLNVAQHRLIDNDIFCLCLKATHRKTFVVVWFLARVLFSSPSSVFDGKCGKIVCHGRTKPILCE